MSFKPLAFLSLMAAIPPFGNGALESIGQVPLGHAGVVAPGHVPLDHLVDSLRIAPESIWFRVRKADRIFSVMSDSMELRRYACVLGANPVGDKRMEGDKRTPEGTFTFRSKRRPHKWHAFIHIDYPNAESRRRFAARKASGEIPEGATIGGEVGIHGVPEGKDNWITSGQDWTFGCISLKNADVDEIYPYITPWGTKLVILP